MESLDPLRSTSRSLHQQLQTNLRLVADRPEWHWNGGLAAAMIAGVTTAESLGLR